MRVWQTIRASSFSRHIHQHAYAALVISGCYEEAGDSGRHRVQAGDVLLHDAYESHLNRIAANGALVLNLSLPASHAFRSGLGRVDDPESIVSVAERSRAEATALLLSRMESRPPECQDWPDQLAAALIDDASLGITAWSHTQGIPAWQLSRSFSQVFGVSPSAFRARARARQAWHAIRSSDLPLASIAARCGFADQSHMTRSVKDLTGRSPGAWRRK